MFLSKSLSLFPSLLLWKKACLSFVKPLSSVFWVSGWSSGLKRVVFRQQLVLIQMRPIGKPFCSTRYTQRDTVWPCERRCGALWVAGRSRTHWSNESLSLRSNNVWDAEDRRSITNESCYIKDMLEKYCLSVSLQSNFISLTALSTGV